MGGYPSEAMLIFAPRETSSGETRVALVPDTVARLVGKGMDVALESAAGAQSGNPDEAYTEAGAGIVTDRAAALSDADVVVRVRKPPSEEVDRLKEGCVHISFLDLFNEPGLIDALVQCKVSAISMEMIPRTTIAQKMDGLSSQANLAGYTAVILAAERLNKIMPMLMTPAGTLSPARMFVIGAGVAGLQAIATARRLGARVDAFDTRPAVAEEVRSLGARFVKVDLGETGQTEQGYAKELTPEQQAKQREGMAKVCAQADVVITTAQLFGRRAPMIVTAEMVRGMKPGSVIVDLAVESGGNVEGVVPGEEVEINGVRIIGLTNLAGRTPVHASQMYSANVGNLIDFLWDEERKALNLDLESDILRGCLVTHDGAITNDAIRARREG